MPAAEEQNGGGLFTDDELRLLRSVERSRVWRLLRDALCKQREDLFQGTSDAPGLTGQPETDRALWMNRGAILLVQWLLQEGPRFVIWYQRYMDAHEEQLAVERARKAAGVDREEMHPERTYDPATRDEKPRFDL